VFLRLCLPPIRLSVTGSGRQRSDLIFRYSYALSLPLSLHRHLLSLDPALSDHPCGPVSRQRLRPSYSNYPPPPLPPVPLARPNAPKKGEKSPLSYRPSLSQRSHLCLCFVITSFEYHTDSSNTLRSDSNRSTSRAAISSR
jgi:hypothetical protein